MTKCAIYCRVSTSGQDISSQLELLVKYAEDQSLEMVDTFIDDGISGAAPIEDKPDFLRLFEAIVNQDFDILLVEEHDRITKDDDSVVYATIIEKLKENNIQLWSPSEGICDLSTFSGRLVSHIKFMMGAEERLKIKRRTHRGRMQKWKNGSCYIGNVPFGYRAIRQNGKRTGKVEKYKPESKIVKKIFSLYTDHNYSMDDVANILIDEGIPTPSVSKGAKNRIDHWLTSTVRNILIRESYTGVAFFNKKSPRDKWVKKEFPPIISKKQFDLVQKRIKFNKQKSKKKYYGLEEKWLVDHVLYCAECGAKMAKKKNVKKESGKIYVSYICEFKNMSAKKLKNFGRERCIMKSVSADKIDKEIFFKISQVLSNPSQFAEQWLKNIDKVEQKTKFENLSKQVAQKEKTIKRAYRDLAKITNRKLRDEFIKGAEKDANELDSLKKRLRKAEQDYNLYQTKFDRLAQFKKAMKKSVKAEQLKTRLATQEEFMQFLYDLPFKEKKRIVEAVIAPENWGRCHLRYQTPDDMTSYYDRISKKLSTMPLIDLEPVIEMDFEMDLDKIEALITGLNRKNLLSNSGLYLQLRLPQMSTPH